MFMYVLVGVICFIFGTLFGALLVGATMAAIAGILPEREEAPYERKES